MEELRQPVGTAFTIRDPLPWPEVARIAHEGVPVIYPVLAPAEGREAAFAVLGTFSS